jgi:hypothetical protein
MSTEEMIEAYLWSWMIIHFHVTGYTQIYAKYARYQYNIPYINFYNEIWHNIKNSTVLYDNYKSLKKTVTEYLTKGTLPENNKGHALHSTSFEIFYKNKSIVYTLGLEVLEHLTGVCPVDIQFIQENFVFDNNQMYPLEIQCGYNILDKYQPGHFLYKVDSKLENYTNSNLFTRTGIIKNKITFLS